MKFFDKNKKITRDDLSMVRVVHQGVDTLVTSHICLDEKAYLKSFLPFLNTLEDLKEQAQQTSGLNQSQRFVKAELLGFGEFKVMAQGIRSYSYIIQNDDVSIFINTHKYGANDFLTPQIRVEYRAHYLFSAGHKQAYNIVLKFINKIMGTTRNQLSRIDLATDVQGITYTPFDALRIQTSYKTQGFDKRDTFVKNFKSEGMQYGKGKFLFRIYDKVKEIRAKAQKSFVLSKWILNDYSEMLDMPVWRHEIQYFREELKKFMPKLLDDEVLYNFNQLDKLWYNAISKLRWADLTNEEVARISENDLKPDSIRKIFQRARQDHRRINFWNILTNWDNKLCTQTIKYEYVKEAKLPTAKRLLKAFVATAYKTLGANPDSLIKVLREVQTELRDFDMMDLHEYGEMKVLSNFVENAMIIERMELNPVNDYSLLVKEKFIELTQRIQNIDEYKELKTANAYLKKRGLLDAG